MEFLANGGSHIEKMIKKALSEGKKQVKITGDWLIERTVRIPSDFTVVLEDCHLRMADNTFCNMFVNENCRTEKGKTINGTDRNIKIIGLGRAILDGGEYNGLSEKNSEKDGRPHICVNNLILFTNVDGFEIKDLHLRNQRWWAMNFIYCRHGKIKDIDFCANDTAILPDGKRVQGLRENAECLVNNADGIDLRVGCHDIMIENISGFTQDDSVACTALYGKMEKDFAVEGLSTDLYNITIRNVNTATMHGNVRLLNEGGTKLYNILVDGVFDSSKDSSNLHNGWRAWRTLCIGSETPYGERHSTKDETYNITIKNIYSRAHSAVVVDGCVAHLNLDNINGFDGCENILLNRGDID